ncbi:MAG: response regulator [bacterium]
MEKEVMIVDDDLTVLKTCKKIIIRNNLMVRTAESGQACLQELEKGFKGIILMDIIMPEMDGWDTINEIVKRGYIKNVIILMLTGKDQPGEKMDNLKEYVLDYIRKPFDSEDLIKLIKKYLSYLE